MLFRTAAAALQSLSQNLQTGTLAIGEAGLQLLRFGSGDLRLTGALRTDGIIRALGGIYTGGFTTVQRDAIPLGFRPYGVAILNTTTNRWEWNSGTDSAPVWSGLGGGGSVTRGTLAARPSPGIGNANTFYFATDDNGGTLYSSDGATWTKVSKGINEAPAAHGLSHHPQLGSDFVVMALMGTLAARPSAGVVAVGTHYLVTDVGGGTLYQSSGSAWVKAARGASENPITSAQTGNYVLTAADAGNVVEVNSATAVNVTVPLNSSVAFNIGDAITIIQTGAGQITIVPIGGVTINATPGLKIAAQWGVATLLKRATDSWIAFGNLVP
jgi:hypothetical protein